MGELLNLVGLSAGVVLYAMLLAMVVGAGRGPGAHRSARFDRLLLLTSILGLVWNLCALPAYVLPMFGVAGPFPFLAAIGFGALGFLPAVVVHSVLRGERDGVRGRLKQLIAAIAYAAAAAAAVLHVHGAWTGSAVPSVVAMRLLTYTFVALIVPLAAATRGQPGSRRALWAAALAIFAVSALHLSQFHTGEASWPVELLGHHASLPLAFAILYQDFPFALADLFLKRALALLAIVAVAFVATATFGARSSAFAEFMRIDPRQVGILVTLWVATALLYPWLRRLTAWFVDTIVLARPDYRSLRAAIARQAQSHDDIGALLSDVCDRLAPALSASAVSWREWRSDGDDGALGAVASATKATALVIVPASELPRYAITVAELTGGRRLLSDDLATLEAIAVVVARRIDAIRITRERVERELREQEIGKLATEAELRALRAQINPHFLFNALTTIAHLIQTAPPQALRTLMRLTSLLRSVLRSEGEVTTLGRELDVVEAYLDIERERFDERLRVTIDVPLHLRTLSVPPLILQPLVENAIKHGIAPLAVGGEVTVRARTNAVGELLLVVHDTGAGTASDALARGRTAGVGLRNVERRLECQYGSKASLSINTTPGRGTIVEIRMPTDALAAGQLDGETGGGVSARLRIVVADDERPARSFLVALLRSFDDVTVVGEAASGKEAVALIEREKPDLALLDWQMPELDGIGVVRTLKKQEMPLIAFVTAYDEYAVRAFEVNAVDYLLKPVDKTRLRETLNRAQELVEHAEIVAEQASRVSAAIDSYETAARGPYLERIPVRHREEVVIVMVSQIASIVADGELLNITTVRNERHTITYRLKDIEARLDPARFIRLGRGTLANVDLIAKVSAMPGGTHVATLSTGQKLQVSRLQSRVLRERFLKL